MGYGRCFAGSPGYRCHDCWTADDLSATQEQLPVIAMFNRFHWKGTESANMDAKNGSQDSLFRKYVNIVAVVAAYWSVFALIHSDSLTVRLNVCLLLKNGLRLSEIALDPKKMKTKHLVEKLQRSTLRTWSSTKSGIIAGAQTFCNFRRSNVFIRAPEKFSNAEFKAAIRIWGCRISNV